MTIPTVDTAPMLTAMVQMFPAGTMPVERSPWDSQLKAILGSNGRDSVRNLFLGVIYLYVYVADPMDKIVFLVTYRAFASGSVVLEMMKEIAEANADLKLRYANC